MKEDETKRSEAIEQLSDWIVKHHIHEHQLKRFEKRKSILDKHGYKEFLIKQKPLPQADKTKKGNCTEIILAEYLKFTTELEMLVYRLRYNPNVDQSMKGDDVLLFNKQNPKEKILIGEAKYRTTPNEAAVKDIIKSYEGDKKMPISIPFVANRLSEMGKLELAEKLEDLNSEMHKLNTPIVNVGLLLSNHNTSNIVERHTDSKNPEFIILSLGINNPKELIERSFEVALQKLEEL